MNRRLSSEGIVLPVIGLVLDSVIELSMTDVEIYALQTSGSSEVAFEGTIEDRWHVVSIRRPLLNTQPADDSKLDPRLQALYDFGVRQVISASIGILSVDKVSSKTCIIPQDNPKSDGSQHFCPRLRVAALTAAKEAGFDVQNPGLSLLQRTSLADENRTARELQMCYVAIDAVYAAEDGIENLSSWLSNVVRATPDAISPLATCSCTNES